jgi:hypothetical protein
MGDQVQPNEIENEEDTVYYTNVLGVRMKFKTVKEQPDYNACSVARGNKLVELTPEEEKEWKDYYNNYDPSESSSAHSSEEDIPTNKDGDALGGYFNNSYGKEINEPEHVKK